MTYTIVPSIKGQITIPASLRQKYHITNETPLVIEDKTKGTITIKVMRLIPDDYIQEYHTEKEFGLIFKGGIDPQMLIDAIKKIDG